MATGASPLPPDARAQYVANLRVQRPYALNHRRVEDVLRELDIGPVQRFLLWLAKTDVFVLGHSSQYTRLTLQGLGMMVLFTSFLAFASGLYALMTMLVDPDSPARWPIGLVLAGVYAFGIMIIDREIVGATSGGLVPFVTRIGFAAVIALAVSYPVKVKFFEQRVQLELRAMAEERNADKLARIKELQTLGEPERQAGRQEVLARIASVKQRIELANVEARREADLRGGCRERCQEFLRQAEQFTQQQIRFEAELKQLDAPMGPAPEVQAEIDRLRAQIENEATDCFDFLCKWEALDRIKQTQSDYWVLSSFVVAFFFLLELVPALLKLTLGKTEYHYYIESRKNLNNQKIISLNNLFMERMRSDPASVFDILPNEITDLMAATMEDEMLNSGDSPNVQTLVESMRRWAVQRETAAATPTSQPSGDPPDVPRPPGAGRAPDTEDDPMLAPRA